MTIVQSVNVFVNSSQRQSGTSNSFSLLLSPELQLKSLKNVWEVKVLTAAIPFSFNQVNVSNNKVFGFINGNLWQTEIPAGNYNILNLITVVKDGIVSACAALGYSVSLTWTYNRSTARTSLSYVGVSSLVVDYGSSTVIMKMLGFVSNISLSSGQSTISSQSVNVNPVQSLYIRSDSLNQSYHNREMLLTPGEVTDILTEVSVLTAPGTYVNFTNPQGASTRITNQAIDRLQLYLSDNNNYQLDLGGLEWTCSLVFNEVTVEDIPVEPSLQQLSTLAVSDASKAKISELESEKTKALDQLKSERNKIVKSLK